MCSKSNSLCCNTQKLLASSEESSATVINDDQIREAVRIHYGNIVSNKARIESDSSADTQKCCNSSAGSCFGPNTSVDYAQILGYTSEDLQMVPELANLGLGCGNPLAFAQIELGFVVLDLGSGAGFDAFIAARKVGPTGMVIGVDMTPDMILKSREKADKNNISNVSFRLGEIEYLPVADSSVDLIISNCVLNLSPQKRQVLVEAFRVLKPGRSVVISDIVSHKPLPENVQKNLALYAGCLAGATLVSDLERYFKEIGYTNVKIRRKDGSDELIKSWSTFADVSLEQFVYSAVIQATKPAL